MSYLQYQVCLLESAVLLVLCGTLIIKDYLNSTMIIQFHSKQLETLPINYLVNSFVGYLPLGPPAVLFAPAVVP